MRGSFLHVESRFSFGTFSDEESFLLHPGELARPFWPSEENFLATSETAEMDAPEWTALEAEADDGG